MDAESIAAIALGSNVGDRAGALSAATDHLRATPSVTLLAVSEFFEYPPLPLPEDVLAAHPGSSPGGAYLNAAATLSTTLQPPELLRALLDIERTLGRDRSASPHRWAPRTLDLDLLICGRHTIQSHILTLPHPELTRRRFVLEPLASIAPNLAVPPSGRTVAQHLADLLLAESRSRRTNPAPIHQPAP